MFRSLKENCQDYNENYNICGFHDSKNLYSQLKNAINFIKFAFLKQK